MSNLKINPRFTSRKFLIAVLFPIFLILNGEFRWLGTEELSWVIKLLTLFMGTEGIADIVERYK